MSIDRESWLFGRSGVFKSLRHLMMVVTPSLYMVAIVTAYRWYFIAVAVLFILSLLCEWEGSSSWAGIGSLLTAIGLFWCALALSALWALDPGLTIGALWLPALYIGLFLCVARWSRERTLVEQTAPFAVLVWAVAGVYLWVYMQFGAIRPVNEDVDTAFGAGSNLGAMHVLVAMPLLLWRLRVAPTLWVVLTCVVGVGVLVVSGTRSALLITPILVLVLAMMWTADTRKHSGYLLRALAVFVALGVVMATSLIGVATWERIADLSQYFSDPSTLLLAGEADYERAITYLEGWNAFVSHPITGIGYWNLTAWLEMRYGWGTSSHNILVTLLGEAGLPAALAFTYVIAQFIARIRMGMRIDVRTSGRAFCAALAVAMLGTLLIAFFHQLLDFQVFYMLLGLASALPVVPQGLTSLRGFLGAGGRTEVAVRPVVVLSHDPVQRRSAL